MDIAVVDNPEAGRYEIRVDGELAGHLAYKRDADTISLMHTEIDPAYEGRGLGSTLVRNVLEAARDDAARVVPYCPFVRSYLRRHQEYRDLLPTDMLDDPDLKPESNDDGG